MIHQCQAYELVWQRGDDIEKIDKIAQERSLVAAWDEGNGNLYARCPAKGTIPYKATRKNLRFCEKHDPLKWPPLFKCREKKCGWSKTCAIDPTLATIESLAFDDAWTLAIQKHLCPQCLSPFDVADSYVNIRGWFLFVPPKKRKT